MSQLLDTIFLLNPVIFTSSVFPSILYQLGTTGTVTELDPLNLVVAHATDSIFSGIQYLFGDIWAWLLYNFITPAIMIIGILLFFYSQYWFIRGLFNVVKFSIGKIIPLFDGISENKTLTKLVGVYKKTFDETN